MHTSARLLSFNEFCNENYQHGVLQAALLEGDDDGWTVGDWAHLAVDGISGVLSAFPATAAAGSAISFIHSIELMVEAVKSFNEGKKIDSVVSFISSLISLAMMIPGLGATGVETKNAITSLGRTAEAWLLKRGKALAGKVAGKTAQVAGKVAVDYSTSVVKDTAIKVEVVLWKATLKTIGNILKGIKENKAKIVAKMDELKIREKVKSLLNSDPIQWLDHNINLLLDEANRFVSICYNMINDTTGQVAFQPTTEPILTLDPTQIQYSTGLPGYNQTPQQIAASTA